MKILSDSEIDFNYRWLKDYYDIVAKINYYETMINKQATQEAKVVLRNEINCLKQDLKDFKTLIYKFKSTFPKVLYLKYLEGYTLEEVANNLGYSVAYIRVMHARFTRELKERGISI